MTLRVAVSFAVLGLTLGSGLPTGRADEKPAKEAVKGAEKGAMGTPEGAWRLVGVKRQGEYAKVPEGYEQTKLIAGGRFAWALVRDGKVQASAGGTCSFDRAEYVEKVEFATEKHQYLVGGTGTFAWKLDGGKWVHEGTVKTDKGDVRIAELWERVTPK